MYDQFSSSTMLLNEINYEINTTFIPKQVGFIRAVLVVVSASTKEGKETTRGGSGLESGVWRKETICSAVIPRSVL
jgi:hypothetical protein